MAFINLLPTTVKKIKRPAPERKKAPVSVATGGAPLPWLKLPLLLPILAAAGIFLAILAMQFMQLAASKKTFNTLEKQIQEIKLGYQKINEITKKKNELNDTLSFMQQFSSAKPLWSDMLSMVSKLIPSQVWLTDITIESFPPRQNQRSKPDKSETMPAEMIKRMTIKGSATSLIEAEIISSITQFVELLKKDDSFNKNFSDIKLGPLQSDRRGNLIIMNFVIYCKSSRYS